jgi:hypothetical protein
MGEMVDMEKVRRGRNIMVHLGDGQYISWSYVVDCPVMFAMTRDECIDLMREANKVDHMGNETVLNSRIERLDRFGTTELLGSPPSAESTIGGNHAGPNGECLTFEAFKRCYGTAEGYDKFELQDGDVVSREDK